MRSSRIHTALAIISIVGFTACKDNKKTVDNGNPVFHQPPVKEYTDRIKQQPDNAQLYFERGKVLDRIEQDTLALNDYKKAASLDSSKAEYFSAIGDLLFEHQDISGSLHWIERALKLNPKDPAAHMKLAKLFIYSKDYTKAFNEINTVLRQDVYNPEGYFLKGIIYKDMKDTSRAISSFQTAVQVDPNYKDAIVQLGLIHSSKGDPIALKYFDNAYRLDSSDVFPIFAKGVYYQDRKDYENAKSLYKQTISKNREYINAYFNMGFVFMQQDSLEKAWRQYDLVTKIEPDNAEAYYSRGLCNELMNKKLDAIADYQQALTFNKNYPEAQEGIKRLQGK